MILRIFGRASVALLFGACALLGGLAGPAAVAAVPVEDGAIAAGAAHACLIRASGTVWCWGSGRVGQLGDDTTGASAPVAKPVDTGGPLAGRTVVRVAAGGDTTCALDTVGRASCWGDGADGELGVGGTTASAVPVAVATRLRFRRIAVGRAHVCAIDTSGKAHCWGQNTFGQLGDGHAGLTATTPVPVDASGVLAGRTLTEIATGWQHTCAVDTAGKAYCWGNNTWGQLGDDVVSGAGSAVPVAVLSTAPLARLTGGTLHTCAVDTAGKTYCWGDNRFGELGNGAKPTAAHVPSAVPTPVRAVAGGLHATCGLADTVYCWGRGHREPAGNGAPSTVDVPTRVPAGALAHAAPLTGVAAGDRFACVRDRKAHAYCWGDNASHQLGDGTGAADSDAPTTVVLRPDPPTAVRVSPLDGALRVTWTPGDPGSGPAPGFTATAVPGGLTCTSAGTSCVVHGLTNGTRYTVRVAVTGSASGASVPAAGAAASGTPSADTLPVTGPRTLAAVLSGLATLAIGAALLAGARRRSGR